MFPSSLLGIRSRSRIVWSVQLNAEVDKVHVPAVFGAAESQGVSNIKSEEDCASRHLIDVGWKYGIISAITNKK